MARIRTIKPEFWKHEVLSELPCEAHMLAAALLNYADDEGYFNANPKLVQAECCPLRNTRVADCLKQLCDIGYIEVGVAEDGRRYGHVVNFVDHQVVDRAKASKIRQLTIVWERSETNRRTIDEGSLQEGKGREQGKGRERGNVERERKRGFQDEFSQTFYPRYPHKVERPAALAAFLTARGKAALDVIMAGLERYIRDKPPDNKWCNPATWLNQERWADEPAAVVDTQKLSRTQLAIGKLRSKYGNDIIGSGATLCGEDRKLPPLQLPAASPLPRGLRRAVGDVVRREAETIAPVDDQSS